MGTRRDAAARAAADDGVSTLYAVQWRPMVRLAWLFVHDDLLAEEIAQDAFISLHRKWSDVQEGRATAYLRQCVVNGARSALRHHNVERRYLDSLRDSTRRLTAVSAEDSVIATAGSADLFARLQTLPDRQREVLVLRYYLDLSEAQIAETLGIAPGSVKAHAHRGLAALRIQMEERP
ncbi:SigE family RNA polymerase sigma factor [Knoellia subterranea]|uniref:RNA polymerase sigma24 factor n=1 Tax=Knoellia subterranea KCTC 19937 TaxID=1385521 RepID=A0A0A0JTS4_9MICO|nr:SigE family RNA polymerase sigma factor [Knoellia subterranea]KGN39061.1 RNA polymerase sigma24 factor [Knoellia subterranea KCTC 19937]